MEISGGYEIDLELGGTAPPTAGVAHRARARLASELGAPVQLRLSYVWQVVLPSREQ